MTRHEQAEKLHELAYRWAAGTQGCLTLETLGEIFGNDFWLLIVYLLSDELKANSSDGYAARVREGFANNVMRNYLKGRKS